MRGTLSASFLLHVAVLFALIFLQPLATLTPPKDESVNVELVQLPQPKLPAAKMEERVPRASVQKIQRPSLTSDQIIRAARAKPVPRIEPKPVPDLLIPAHQLYSEKLLSDRHNKSARQAMKQLAADERMIQLCDLEAMEQVRRAKQMLKPDYVVAYAMSDIALSEHGVEAGGGAFHSRRDWYGIKFRCALSPDDSKVVSFAFLVGAPIPRSQWAAHNLTADSGSAD
jgi:hypothetical protein